MRSGLVLTFSSKCDIMKDIWVPCFTAFFCATFRAFSDMSVAMISASFSSFLRVMAIQPEPVPISTITGFSGSSLLVGLTPGR